MGNKEDDKLTEGVNLQSFSSPYSPQFVINKKEFKGKSLKNLIKEHLDSGINFNENNTNKNNPINNFIKSDLNYSLFINEKKDKIIDISIPSTSTEDDENKKNINFKIN